MKTVAGFANADGGYLYLGVEDKTNKLRGTGVSLDVVLVDNGTKYDQKVLEYCYVTAKKSSEIAAYLGLTDSTYFRKKVLKNLEDNGYLVSSSLSGTKYYKTDSESVRLA